MDYSSVQKILFVTTNPISNALEAFLQTFATTIVAWLKEKTDSFT